MSSLLLRSLYPATPGFYAMNPAPTVLPGSSSSSTTTSSETITRSSSSKSLSPADFKSPSYPQYVKSPSLSAWSPKGGQAISKTTSNSPSVNSKRRSSRPPQTPRLPSSSSSSPAASRISNHNSTMNPPATPVATHSAPSAPSPAGKASTTASTPTERHAKPSSPPKRPRHSDPSIKYLPSLYQHCPTQDLVYLISDMLLELVGLNDKIPLSGAGLTRFHSRAPPTISIPDYLSRLAHHASLQPSILLSMVYYIDILSTHYPPFVVSSLTVHRFLITAATVATKGLCDSFLTNGFYAKVGGVSLMELNLLELEFLVRVGWRIVPKGEVLDEYYRSLVGRCQSRYSISAISLDGDNNGEASNAPQTPPTPTTRPSSSSTTSERRRKQQDASSSSSSSAEEGGEAAGSR